MTEAINKTRRKISLKKLERLGDFLLSLSTKLDWELSVSLVGSARMRQLNRQYRQIDKSTDVLSFRLDFPKTMGEIVICPDEIEQDSKYLFLEGVAKKDRLPFIIIHGWLHLLGHDDDSEPKRKKMMDMGYRLMEKAKKNGII
jgi:probable rRNA maturation factor